MTNLSKRLHVALLLNFIPPYRVPLFEVLQTRVGKLRIFVSTPMEPNRTWTVRWGCLDVVVQRNMMIRQRRLHPRGFSEELYVHIPYDAIAHLWKYRPDVIVCGELGMRTCLAVIYKSLHRSVRLVIWATLSEETERNRGPWRRLIRRFLLPRADAVIVNGNSGARYVAGFGVPAERVRIVPQTVDVTAFSRSSLQKKPSAARSLLYVGRLDERKGMNDFVAQLSRWAAAHPGRFVKLEIAGDGPERRKLAAIRLPIGLEVSFLGDIPYEDIPGVYARSDLLVFPTFADEWGLVVNEAMACGLPVLGSCYSQAVEEMVTDGETGWIFAPDDAESTYRAIDRALQASGADLYRMGQAACTRAMQLTPRDIADRIAEVLSA